MLFPLGGLALYSHRMATAVPSDGFTCLTGLDGRTHTARDGDVHGDAFRKQF